MRSVLLPAAAALLLANHAPAAQPVFRADQDFLVKSWETGDGLPENSATAIVQSPDGYLWAGTFGGLARFNGDSFTVFDPDNTPALPSAVIVNLHFDHRGWMWVSTDKGLVSREGETWRRWRNPEGWTTGEGVRSFAERPNGDLFLTTFNGLCFEFAGGRFAELPASPCEKGYGCFAGVDEEGHWWVVQNRVEVAGLRLPPLPHHPACGSAPGGSNKTR